MFLPNFALFLDRNSNPVILSLPLSPSLGVVQVLDWERRSTQLIREVGYHHPDICCFQEVQSEPSKSEKHHLAWLQNRLEAKGYGHVYARKTPVKGVTLTGLQIGNMIAWKKARFELVDYEVGAYSTYSCIDTYILQECCE